MTRKYSSLKLGFSSLALGLCSGLILAAATPGAAAQESAVLAIASRSYAPAETGRIAGRSVLTRAARQPRQAVAPQQDPVAIERTERYTALIDHHAHRQGLDSDLIKAIICAESGGDRQAVSGSGAIGLMQLMPQTAGDLGIADPFDADASIDGGTRYLRELIDRYGATEIALWAYNAGPGAVDRGHLPNETVNYVPRVLRLSKHFKNRRTLAAASE
ncbi:MAG: transglycosylase SLT domain-containing protein [Gemmatimonadetes bacterium]|nr:transglycosylase SLT domain-containing protein [Gemmatimonadota bacterium]MBT7862870.1 transglycosylase SLT domain-containing protein [Gemmatimonadota bacterium]